MSATDSDQRIRIVLDGLWSGRINEEEASYYLRTKCGMTLAQAQRIAGGSDTRATAEAAAPQNASPTADAMASHAPTATAAASASHNVGRNNVILYAAVIIMILGIGSFFLVESLPTGYITLDIAGKGVTSAAANGTTAAYPIELNVTGLNVSGILYGDGLANIFFDTRNGTLLVATVRSDDGSPRTDQASYALGENVSVDHAPSGASYYFDDGNATATVSVPFPAAVNGMLLIVANESGNLSTYRLPVIIGDAQRAKAFSDLCEETCVMDPANGTLRVETLGNATLQLTTVDAATPTQSRPPVVTAPFAPIAINDTVNIDLSQHFASPDGNALYYSVGSSGIVDASLNGSVLTLRPLQDGTEDILVYASDLNDIASASMAITVTLPAPTANGTGTGATGNATTGTSNSPSNETSPAAINATAGTAGSIIAENSTINATANVTANTTAAFADTNSSLDCSNPDPNLRPVDCLNANATTLLAESIYWENTDRAQVARFTAVGNLLIKGRVLENDAGSPAPGDFAITYRDANLNNQATIWVDSVTGDLRLHGYLHEENDNLDPPQGSYTVMNRRGVFLAYADSQSGDLYVRGNVIPYRTDING